MPLMTELKNGDEVEIIRSKAQVPPAAWESIAVTGKARAAIRRATRTPSRKQYAAGSAAKSWSAPSSAAGKTFTEDGLASGAARLSQKDAEDVIAAVGRGEIASADVIRAMYPEYKDERVPSAPKSSATRKAGSDSQGRMLKFQLPGRGARTREEEKSGALPIRGAPAMPVSFAPRRRRAGDRIVGILTPGQGITIYPIHAEALKASTRSRSAGSTSPGTSTKTIRSASRREYP